VNQLYVIMPVGSDPMYPERRTAIEDGAATAGFEAHFPLDDSPIGRFDLESTKKRMRASDAVLADLTKERPSCYYEVGLAQALNPRVLLVATRDTAIHQVAGRRHVEFYSSLDDLRMVLARQLPKLSEGDSAEGEPR
jgi:nucleoside 2-deoxyribosyltransferase